MKIFITGVSSSLGLKVAEIGKQRGFKIGGSVRSSKLPFDSEFVDTVVGLDLEDSRSFENIPEGFDCVVHVAALSYGSPSDLMLATGLGAFHLLERAKSLRIQSLIHVSAVSVYGRAPTGLVGASTPVQHSTPYGVAKWAAECYLSVPESGVNCVSVRCPAILEKDYSPHLLGRLRDEMISGGNIKLSNPDFKFNNFVTLDTLANFLIDLVVNTPKGYNAFAIGSSEPQRFCKVIQMIAHEVGYTGSIDWVESISPPFSIGISDAVGYGFSPSSVHEGLCWWFNELH